MSLYLSFLKQVIQLIISNLCLIIIGTHFESEFCLMHYLTATHDQTEAVG